MPNSLIRTPGLDVDRAVILCSDSDAEEGYGAMARQGDRGSLMTDVSYSIVSVVSVVVVLLLWFALTNAGIISRKTLPSPQDIVGEARTLFADGYTGKPMIIHFRASLLRTLIGLGASLIIGIPIGLLVGESRLASAMLTPFFSFLRPVPAIAFIPLVILYFGIGEFSKVVLIFVTATLYIILNTSAGVKSVPAELIRAGRNVGLTRRQLFLYVILPASAPHVMTGVKTATAVSWALVVAAELVAAQEGLGYMIMDAATFFRLPDVYIAIALIGLIGLALEIAESMLENRLLHWRGK